MPIADFHYIESNWSTKASSAYAVRENLDSSMKIFSNEKGMAKIRRMFEKTPLLINFYVIAESNFVANEIEFRRTGDYDDATVIGNVEKIIRQKVKYDGRISIVYSNNATNDHMPITGWMLAHRMGHTLQSRSRYDMFLNSLTSIYDKLIGELLKQPFVCSFNLFDAKEISRDAMNIINRLHTMKSARDGVLGGRWIIDGLGELIAQRLITGRIRLNRLEGFENQIALAEDQINKEIDEILKNMIGRMWCF